MVTKDKAFYGVVHIAEASSEIMVAEANEESSRIEEIKELILRKASELRGQFKE